MRRSYRKRQELKNSLTGRIGLNINGDLEDREILERVRLAEEAGIRMIWVGEFEGFQDPFEVAEIISKNSKINIGFGVLSVSRRECEEIIEEFEGLKRKYGERYVVGLGAGNYSNAAEAFKKLKDCTGKFPFCVVGASSPKTLKLASRTSGVLFNSVNPEFVKWMDGFVEKDVFKAAYGPSLILPSEFEEDLIIAASIVFLGSKTLISEFEMQSIADEISGVDIARLIEQRRLGRSIADLDDADKLLRHKDFLLQNFTLSGSTASVAEKIMELLKICDHIVLSDPFFRDLNSMKELKELVKMVNGD